MLDDRRYMKSSPLDRRPVTTVLLIVLGAIYIAETCLIFYKGPTFKSWLDSYLALSLDGIIVHGRYWQIFTFQFLHQAPSPFHVLFNCMGLYFLGRGLEEALGRAGFLRLYLFSGTFGGVLQLFATWLLTLVHHGEPAAALAASPLVGASAGVMGLLAAYATLFPTRELTVFIYLFPLTVRARYLFWAALVVSLVGTSVPLGQLAHGANLGGVLMGWAYIQWGIYTQGRFNWRPFRNLERKRELVKAASVRANKWSRSKIDELDDLPPQEFISREVDPILDKISAHGIQSLTPREKEVLEAARLKMEKR